jgi:DNA-binding transcriptional ArsR family regulator
VVVLAVIASPGNVHYSAIIHAYVNDGMLVNMWQDVTVDEEPEIRYPETRYIEDAETLKALAEPTRIAILTALLRPPWPRVMSVKELAAELDMTQTRLYRHIRQLEEADLIEVAETRVVSGILEQRYQANVRDVRFGPDFLLSHPDESLAAFRVLFDEFARGMLTATEKHGVKPQMFYYDPTISPEAAMELGRRLLAIEDWLKEVPEDPDGIQVSALFGFYPD